MNDLLPLIFLGLMGFAILVYVVLDGFDLGVGILLPGANDAEKDRMIASIGPFWDANETWLVLGVGMMLVAFPVAHGVILGALYLPTTAMLIGLILRGVAFDFRVKAHSEHKPLWNLSFFVGSTLAAAAQGWMLGSHVLGFRGDALGVAFAALIAVCLCAGYALLGGCWLLMKSEGALRDKAARWAYVSLWLTGLGIFAVSLMTPFASASIFAKWFALPNLFFLSPIPLASAVAFGYAEMSLRGIKRGDTHRDWAPFVAVVVVFLLAFAGLAYSLFPWLVIDRIDYQTAAADRGSLAIILAGAAVTLPMILAYTVMSYRVFWGRSKALEYE